LGNLCQRVIKFAQAKLDSKIPEYDLSKFPALLQHKDEVNKLLEEYIANLKGLKLRSGLATIMLISGLGNKLLQDNKLSNQLIAEEPERCNAVVGIALNHIHLLANLLTPYMPGKSQSILKQLGLKSESEEAVIPVSIPDVWEADALKPGHVLGAPELLFSNIPAAKIEEWREAYGGEELRKLKEIEAQKAAAKKAAREAEKEKKKLKKLQKAAAEAAEQGGAPAAGETASIPVHPAKTEDEAAPKA